MRDEEPGSGRVIAAWAIANVALSVSLVAINKIIMNTYGFRFVLVLSSFHFFSTAIFLEAVTRCGYFGVTKKVMPATDNLKMASLGAFSIVMMNLSLQLNSISFYQVTKLCIIPVVLVMDFVKDGKTQTYRVWCALAILLLGVGIATVTDMEMSLKGTVVALTAIVSTAQSQMWVGSMQKKHILSPIQGTHSVAAPQAGITVIAALLFEHDILNHKFDTQNLDIFWIAITCLLAMLLNVTSFGLIGETSATTFQVVGHAKTCLVIAWGYVLKPRDIFNMEEGKNLCGITIAVVGMILYGHIKVIDSKRRNGEQVQDCLDSCLPGDLFEQKVLIENVLEEESPAPLVPESSMSLQHRDSKA